MINQRQVLVAEHVGFGQCAFAVAPGNFFDSHNATAATVDPPHRVKQEDQESPQGNELKAPLTELVVTRAGWWQREQTAAEPLRGRTETSMLFWSGWKRAW